MPNETYTWWVNKEHSVANTSGGSNTGSGKDTHSPVGLYSGWTWRQLMQFSHDWSSIEGCRFVKAELKMKTSGAVHVAFGSTPRISVGRLSGSFDATHTGGGENSWGTTYGTVWGGPTLAVTATSMPAHTTADLTVVTFDISDVFEAYVPATLFKRDGTPGGGATNNGLRIGSNNEASTTNTSEFLNSRGAYSPRIILTVFRDDLHGFPSLDAPTGVKSAAQTLFLAVATHPTSKYDIQVSTDSAFGTFLWNASGLTTEIDDGTGIIATYAGTTQPTGVPIYWRMRTANSLGEYGPWASPASFSISVAPTATVVLPVASGLAEIWNLGEAVVWTDAGSHAKPRVRVLYSHPSGATGSALTVSLYTTGDVLVGATTRSGTFTSGTEYDVDVDVTRVRNASFKVAVKAVSGGITGAESAKVTARMQWAQGQYTVPIGASTSDWRWQAGALTGTGAKAAYLFRGRGTVTDAWKTTIGACTPETNLDVLVRLSTTSANPTLPSMKALWSATAVASPDHWSVTGGVLSLDTTQRRYGVKSFKVKSNASTVCTIKPFTTTSGDGVLVSKNTTYTFSTYVNTNGAVANWVQLAVLKADGTDLAVAPVTDPDPIGATKNSSNAPEHWERIWFTFDSGDEERIQPAIRMGGTTSQEVHLDGHQLEEGPVASGWRPGLVGQSVVVDVGGLAVDARAGGTFRLRGSDPSEANLRSVIELGTDGLMVGGADNPVHFHSPQAGVLHVGVARLNQRSKPANPAAGTGVLYASTTPDVRFLLPDGSETVLGAGGGGAHPDLATHNTMGLATDAEFAAHTHAQAWPVGAVFIAVVSTNPATLLGYGTWAAFGTGRVLVGRDSGDTDFDVVEETGGAKTVAAAGTNTGEALHTHTGASHFHNTPFSAGSTSVLRKVTNSLFGVSTSSSPAVAVATTVADATASLALLRTDTESAAGTSSGTSHNHAFTGTATSVLQPYIVVYMWKRTA